MRSDREKADDRSIPGPYKDLANEVRRIFGYFSDDLPLISARQAALKSGVNHATISSLVSGARASRDSLKQIARAFNADEAVLLRLAGYAPAVGESHSVRYIVADLTAKRVPDGLPDRIYHKIEQLSERDLLKLERMLEVWVDDGHEIGR